MLHDRPVLFFLTLLIASGGIVANLPADEAASDSSQTGVIEGRVIYKADKKRRWRFARYYIASRKKGYLAEAVVALRGGKLKKWPAKSKPETVAMDQKDVRFVPETVVIRAGDRVQFTNSDPQVHNVNSRSSLAPFDVTISTTSNVVQSFPKAGGIRQPIVLGCKLHSAMQAWIFVFSHPFYQLTGKEGRYRLEGVPPGKYRIELAHPAGRLRATRTVEVKAGQTVKLDIRVSPDNKSG